MRKILLLFILFGVTRLLPVTAAPAQTGKPRPAQALVADAVKQANAGHKRIFVHFSSSW